MFSVPAYTSTEKLLGAGLMADQGVQMTGTMETDEADKRREEGGTAGQSGPRERAEQEREGADGRAGSAEQAKG